jgi:hypothetical protein
VGGVMYAKLILTSTQRGTTGKPKLVYGMLILKFWRNIYPRLKVIGITQSTSFLKDATYIENYSTP